MKYSIIPGAGLIILLLTLPAGCNREATSEVSFQTEMITQWNSLVFQYAVEEDGLLTLKGVRTAAMMHSAIHDAVNAVKPVYKPYLFRDHQPDAHPVAAAVQAAYAVAVDQYPDHKPEFDDQLNKWLSDIPEGKPKEDGIALGKAAASQILERRKSDNYNGEAEYTWHPMAPGVYAEFKEHSATPEGFIFGAGWAQAKPFLLESQAQFRSPSPPEINSDEYTRAFEEVKAYGRTESQVRTPDQTHLAMWWKDFVENSHNRLARELVKRENLDLWQTARVFALLNMSVYDAYVSVFENKFHYNHWRPYTAIRWAANDGNPDTEPDTSWNNLHKHTYAFPSYPSAHGTASMAAMTVLAHTLGTGDEYSFDMTTRSVDKAGPFSEKVDMNPAVRSFDSFSEAAMEASMSRLYLGIHFRYDSEEGYNLGKKIGEYAVNNFLVPVREED